jgi:hypothetical protein
MMLFHALAVLDLLRVAQGRCARLACKMLLFMRRLRPVMMLSSTLMPLNRARFWKVRAMPISATWRLSMWPKVWPRNVIAPSCGVYTPLMQLSMELLPAPLGPMMARISCSRTLKEMSVSAFTPPKRKRDVLHVEDDVADAVLCSCCLPSRRRKCFGVRDFAVWR